MKIVGLTGSIASGKSTVAQWIRNCGIPVYDADAIVHGLLEPNGEAVEKVLTIFGSAFGDLNTGINRKTLGNFIFKSAESRRKLEDILHPLVQNKRDLFLEKCESDGFRSVVLDVPLLFETGGDINCDYVIVVYAKLETMRKRAMLRPGMTHEKFNSILNSQMSITVKMLRADLILDSDMKIVETKQKLFDWLEKNALSKLTNNRFSEEI